MNPRPRPRIIDKQRPEVTLGGKKDKSAPKQTDHNMSLGVPGKLRKGADQAFQELARKNAAMGGD